MEKIEKYKPDKKYGMGIREKLRLDERGFEHYNDLHERGFALYFL